MNQADIEPFLHDHVFGQDRKKPAERRMLLVIVITALTMLVEIVSGVIFGSMALLADGLHMGSHASALGISYFAYYYTRKRAGDSRFNFGTGKINSLAAFASGILIVLFALTMVWESISRMIAPVPIEFDKSILVAVLGFVVNAVCLGILGMHNHTHEYPEHAHPHHARDHNLWSAYLHVLADALTSVFAVVALLIGKYTGLVVLDPLMGIVGAILIILWSRNLFRASIGVLLDVQAPEKMRHAIRESLEAQGDARVYDLHVWAIGPGIYASEIGLVNSETKPCSEYASRLPDNLGLVHVHIATRDYTEIEPGP